MVKGAGVAEAAPVGLTLSLAWCASLPRFRVHWCVWARGSRHRNEYVPWRLRCKYEGDLLVISVGWGHRCGTPNPYGPKLRATHVMNQRVSGIMVETRRAYTGGNASH